VKRPGDVVVASIHWGTNWGWEVPSEHVRVAHRLVDAGVDVVHGHSSHHVRPIEIYRGRLVLYGCGEFIDDYEGISGYEAYRNDLVLAYVVTTDPVRGELGLRMRPFRIRNMRLVRAAPAEAGWLMETLNRISDGRGEASRVELASDGTLTLRVGEAPAARRRS
jgi:poly-gamma-glutamate synthesis protein (capsule biosynthesis protein)